jgi:hypothetical protein
MKLGRKNQQKFFLVGRYVVLDQANYCLSRAGNSPSIIWLWSNEIEPRLLGSSKRFDYRSMVLSFLAAWIRAVLCNRRKGTRVKLLKFSCRPPSSRGIGLQHHNHACRAYGELCLGFETSVCEVAFAYIPSEQKGVQAESFGHCT